MNTNVIVEMAPFQVIKGVTEEKLLEASKVLQQNFLSHQKGFLKRELLKTSDCQWVDVVYWASAADAEAAAINASESLTSFEFFELMDLDGVREEELLALHFEKTLEY